MSPYDENDPYFIHGLVDPDEWDWRTEMKKIAQCWFIHPKTHVAFDVGKLLGLAQRLDELENG